MAHPMLVLLAEGEAHESPQAVSRRSLSSLQQYNSSADARDTGLVTVQTNDEKQSPPQLAYNASNDEQGLLLFGLSPQPGTEIGADDEEEELVASDAKLEQNNFEDVESAFAELIVTTTTTATSHMGLVGSVSTPTSSRPPYMFACDNYSNEDRYDNNSDKGSLTIEKHVVLFGYDLLIASQQQTSIDSVSSMIHEFETRLLEQVGSELLKSTVETNLLCDRSNSSGDELQTASGRERKGSQGGMSLRGGYRRVFESHLPRPVQLSRLSSLPTDKISNATNCAEDTASSTLSSVPTTTETTISCYPIAGYMTVYYYNEEDSAQYLHNMNTYIDKTMQDIIQRSISKMTDNNTSIDNEMVYVGSQHNKGTSTISDEFRSPIQLQLGQESASSSNPWLSTPMLVGTIVAGSLAVIAFGLLIFFAKRRSRTKNMNTDCDFYDDSMYRGDGNRSMIIPPIHCDKSMHNNFPHADVGCHEEFVHQQLHHEWLPHAMTVETDTTPRISNVYVQQRRNVTGTFHGQSIRECDDEDDDSTCADIRY